MNYVTICPMSYVIENPIAAQLLESAADALRAGNRERMTELRQLAALVEDGKMLGHEAIEASGLRAAA